MDLLEYQAKELFREMGIPVLPSQRIDHPSDLKGLRIPYPIVLKSQVRAGGRGKAGGVKFVENTIDAVAAAQTIFHLAIMGEYPQVVLAETKYDADQEFYLAVVLDRTVRRPILLGSQQGGIQAESAWEQIQQVVVDEDFSPFYARRLMVKMGVQGQLISSVSGIVEKMYQLFVEKDLDLVEINPLGISATGEVMALDGKVTANDEAIARHPDIVALTAKNGQRAEAVETFYDTLQQVALSYLNFVQLDGNIGIICNGAGLTMATLDLVYQAGGAPANFLNLGGETRWDSTAAQLRDRLEVGLALVSQDKNVKVVLVNILGGLTCSEIAEAIERQLLRGSRLSLAASRADFPELIVRIVGSDLEQAEDSLTALKVTVVDRLDDAIASTVALAKKIEPLNGNGQS